MVNASVQHLAVVSYGVRALHSKQHFLVLCLSQEARTRAQPRMRVCVTSALQCPLEEDLAMWLVTERKDLQPRRRTDVIVGTSWDAVGGGRKPYRTLRGRLHHLTGHHGLWT